MTATSTATTEPGSTSRQLPSPDPFEPRSIPATLEMVADAAVEKAANPAGYLLRSVSGGAMVAFGVLLSLVVSTGVSTPGVASLLMGLAFGFSFVLILVSGMSLITADMAAGLVAVLGRRMSVGSYLGFLAIGLIGNLAGALLFVLVAAAAGGPHLTGAFSAHAYSVGLIKSGFTGGSALLLGVLCTWFLQTAMILYYKARTDIARMAFAFYGPFAFVIGGTEHVIANAGFIGFPLLLHALHPAAPLAAAARITWGFGGHGLLSDLVVVTVGNFLGGTVLVALPFYVLARLQTRSPRR